MRQDAIKQICRREYESAIGTMHQQITPEASAIPLAKLVVEKIKKLCSLKDKSVFQGTKVFFRVPISPYTILIGNLSGMS